MPGVANPAEIRRRACAEKTHSTRALDVEELETRDTTRERKSVNAPLRDGFVCAGVGLVVEDMNRAVPYLQEIEVTGDGAGAHIAIWTKRRISEQSLIRRAAEHEVGIYGMSRYFLTQPSRTAFLLGYARMREREIREGIRRLGEVF